jgi:hypothetical protein
MFRFGNTRLLALFPRGTKPGARQLAGGNQIWEASGLRPEASRKEDTRMDMYCVRDNETYEPRAMFPAPDSLSAAQIMRRDFPNQPVHVVNCTSWSHKTKAEAIVEIVANCVTTQLNRLPN